MSTTLPNGLIAIDEGNTAWYSDITANWTLLDQKVGTVNALKPVATSGDYNDLTNKPTIPAVNDGTLTIKVNGATAGTFTANQATNEEININAGGDITYATDADMAEMAETWSV